jgi:C-terminal processing protease CtpA/Prc
VIADVVPGSPACETGLRRGDQVLKINNRKMQEEISDDYSSICWQKNELFCDPRI